MTIYVPDWQWWQWFVVALLIGAGWAAGTALVHAILAFVGSFFLRLTKDN